MISEEPIKRASILIIDDDPDITEAMTAILENHGYQVRTAPDGSTGMQRLRESQPDLVILDVMMRTSREGFELARELKHSEAYKDVPILLLTAVRHKTGLDFKTAAGDTSWLPVEAYLDKPVRPDLLLQTVDDLLRRES